MPRILFLLVPLGLAVAALTSGGLAVKLGVALSCAVILLGAELSHRKAGPRDAFWVVAALILSAVGDWFLSNRGRRESYFIAGIGFFFGAHVGFLSYAWRQGRLDWRVLGGLLLVYLPYYVLGLRPSFGSAALSIAVLGYLLISCLALSVACGLRLPLAPKVTFIAGIALIVFSDTLISFNEFLRWRQWNWLILPTYYLAHLCITTAVLGALTRRSDQTVGAQDESHAKTRSPPSH